eukprot:4528605-Alexandrium_andersonii.AAC.1
MAGRAAAAAKRHREGTGQSASSAVPPPPAPDKGAGLRAHLLGQWKSGAMPAKQVCSIAWLATNAGARGVADLGVDPASPGQHFADHLGKAIR